MAEAQENSVLTSLKELRRQEEERVKQEKPTEVIIALGADESRRMILLP